MRILGFHACGNDASAAVFDDYKLIAAVQEERLTRVKGWGDGIPWLAIDEVLQIAGWNRREEAGELLGMSGRHFRRLCDRHEEEERGPARSSDRQGVAAACAGARTRADARALLGAACSSR